MRQIPVIERRGHALTRVESHDIDADPNFALDLQARLLQRQEAATAGDAELHDRDARNVDRDACTAAQ